MLRPGATNSTEINSLVTILIEYVMPKVLITQKSKCVWRIYTDMYPMPTILFQEYELFLF